MGASEKPLATPRRVAVVLPALLALLACTEVANDYPCTLDAQCARDGSQGRCELSGYCSYADAGCAESGHRYSDFAASHSGACVRVSLERFGGEHDDYGASVAVTGNDRFVVGGAFGEGAPADSAGTFVAEPLISRGDTDVLIASLFLQSAQVEWVRVLGLSGTSYVNAVVAAGGGDVFLAGNYLEQIWSFDGTSLGTMYQASYVARLGPDGFAQWVGNIEQVSEANAVVTDARGDLLVGGEMGFAALHLSDSVQINLPHGNNAFAASYAATGAPRWASGFGARAEAQGSARSRGVAATDGDEVALVGDFTGTVDFYDAQRWTVGEGHAAFVATLGGSDGNTGWSWALEGIGGDDVSDARAVVFRGGEVIVAGTLTGAALFGLGQDRRRIDAVGTTDAFVAALRVADGSLVWVERIGISGATEPQALGWTASGALLVGGHFDGQADFGNGVRQSRGGTDVFLVAFDLGTDGPRHRWSRTFGGGGSDILGGLGAAPSGEVLAVGTFEQTLAIDAVEVTSAGGLDGFIALFAP